MSADQHVRLKMWALVADDKVQVPAVGIEVR